MFANLIPHGNFPGLSPEGQMIAIIVGLLFFVMGSKLQYLRVYIEN